MSTSASTSTEAKGEEENKGYMKVAPPPLTAVAVVVASVAMFASNFPSLEQIDEFATVETFTNRVFPEYLSLEGLVYARFAFFALIVGVTIFATFIDEGWVQATNYLPSSKLKDTPISMTGFRTQLPFTSWSWNLLGLSFALSGYIAYAASNGIAVESWVLRTSLIVYEIAAPQALLVSTVVTYAIWPQQLKNTGDTTGLRNIKTLLWHNANSFMALMELAMLGGVPVVGSHVTVAPMVGFVYVIFSWSAQNFWKPEDGPQFIYFFFDTTLGNGAALVIVALLCVLMAFFGLFYAAGSILSMLGTSVLTHSLFVVVVCAGVVRFKD